MLLITIWLTRLQCSDALIYNKSVFYLYIVPCLSLTAPNNGMITCSLEGDGVPIPGETCIITCNTGYQLIGSVVRTCQNDGSWSGSDAICKSE